MAYSINNLDRPFCSPPEFVRLAGASMILSLASQPITRFVFAFHFLIPSGSLVFFAFVVNSRHYHHGGSLDPNGQSIHLKLYYHHQKQKGCQIFFQSHRYKLNPENDEKVQSVSSLSVVLSHSIVR
jgi:hypothetical protein